MFRYLAEKAVDNYPVDWNDNPVLKEACLYRVEVMISTVFNMIVVTLLAILFSKEIECFIFFFVNSSLRFFSGGHHAKNHFSCILTYVTVMFSCIALAFFLKSSSPLIDIPFAGFTSVLSIVTNYLLSAKGEHLDEAQKIAYHKSCMLILSVYILLIIGICSFNLCIHPVSTFVRYCMHIECLTLIMQSCSLIKEKLGKDN